MDYSRLITTTSQAVAPFVVDAIHGSSVLVGRATGSRIKPWEMGVYERQPIQVEEVSTAVDFQGIGNFNTADNSTDVNLQWEAKGLGDSVVIGYAELGLNQTKAQVINLVKRKFDVITSRAFSDLAEFVRLTRHLLAEGGEWAALKGVYPDEEIAQLPEDVCVREVIELKVPGLDAERHLVKLGLR